jgi:hypothetical protein
MDKLEERMDVLERDMAAVKQEVYGKACAICGTRLTGRRDQIYCGAACRSKACRIRREDNDRRFGDI